MRRRGIALSFLAITAIACSEYEVMPGSGVNGVDASGARDGAADDAAPLSDAPTVTDAATDVVTDAGEMAMDAMRVDARDASLDSPYDGVVPDGALADVGIDDATSADVTDGVTDDIAPDGTIDPTAPRFPRTGKYTIVFPPLRDAGTGTSDASVGDAGDAGDAGAGARRTSITLIPRSPTASYAFRGAPLQGAKVARGFIAAWQPGSRATDSSSSCPITCRTTSKGSMPSSARSPPSAHK
jgi:hypothetical protein